MNLAEKKNSRIKININQIPSEGLTIEQSLDAKDLDLQIPGVNFSQPLGIKLKAYMITNAVTANVELETKINSVCSRCLTELNRDLNRRFDFNYSVNSQQNYIDLTEDIREELILCFPMKSLCRVDCRGLCPKCGKDLNQDECNCIK